MVHALEQSVRVLFTEMAKTLEIILIPEAPATEPALLTAPVAIRKHPSSDTIAFRRAARVTVNSQPGMWLNADGELIGNEPPPFAVLPRAWQLVTAP